MFVLYFSEPLWCTVPGCIKVYFILIIASTLDNKIFRFSFLAIFLKRKNEKYLNSIENCNVYSRVFIFKIHFFLYIFRLNFIENFSFFKNYILHSYRNCIDDIRYRVIWYNKILYLLLENANCSIIILIYFVILPVPW